MINLRNSVMVGVAAVGILTGGGATASAAPSMPLVVHCPPGRVLVGNVCQAPPYAGWWWDGAYARWAPPSPHAGWVWDGVHGRWNPPPAHH
ncbi:MAG: hypothetical protein QOG20_4923 [Pseudonocardiales bacterium]|jgi:hypothetical protein|nr:hypothetical protein [Pseudonocardiales bacterium]